MKVISRQVRENLESSFFHVMVQGIGKEYIFSKEQYIKMYLKLLNEKRKELRIKIIAYCIMNNHAHLLIEIQNIKELSKFMQKVNRCYAQYYNFMENRVGYVFRDRYKCQIIKNQKHLIQCIKYIHQNPVKAEMVKDSQEYKFSSYNFYQRNINKLNKIFSNEELTYILKSNNAYGNFIDVDNNPEEIINNLIEEFLIKENAKIFEIFEKDDILKRLIRYLKFENGIKYTEIMKRLDITKGKMERLKIK